MSRRRRRSPGLTLREWAWIGLILLAALGALTLLHFFDDRWVSPSLRGLTLMVAAATAIGAGYALRSKPRPGTTLAQFLAMDPTAFEHATAEVLGWYGYRLTVTGGAGTSRRTSLASTPTACRPWSSANATRPELRSARRRCRCSSAWPTSTTVPRCSST